MSVHDNLPRDREFMAVFYKGQSRGYPDRWNALVEYDGVGHVFALMDDCPVVPTFDGEPWICVVVLLINRHSDHNIYGVRLIERASAVGTRVLTRWERDRRGIWVGETLNHNDVYLNHKYHQIAPDVLDDFFGQNPIRVVTLTEISEHGDQALCYVDEDIPEIVRKLRERHQRQELADDTKGDDTGNVVALNRTGTDNT